MDDVVFVCFWFFVDCICIKCSFDRWKEVKFIEI